MRTRSTSKQWKSPCLLARRSRLPLCAFCLIFGTAPCNKAHPQQGARGSAGTAELWEATGSISGDVPVSYYLELHRNTDAITGRVRMTWGWEAVRDSEVHGDSFTLKMADALPIRIEGSFRGKTLDFTLVDPRSTPMHLLAHRTDRLPASSVALPLPPIRDLSASRVGLSAPPMGWNSWNHFAERIDDAAVRRIADSLVSSGMRDAGYEYVLIDDGWAALRGPDGRLRANSKFPDMPALAAYVHARGLRFGLYSSPGPRTCGAYQGSLGHEEEDAAALAAWGVDYLKYDWCSAGEMYRDEQMQAVFQKMGAALQRTGRPIVFAICQYGLASVEDWGAQAGGALWRISGDIQDNWPSMRRNALAAELLARTGKTEQWNDPDLLEIGNGGMTAAEYRTQMSLWAILAAPLIAGNDPSRMDETTRATLLNRDVIAIDQDPLGKVGTLHGQVNGIEIWSKPLQENAVAIALVNTGNDVRHSHLLWRDLGIASRPDAAKEVWALNAAHFGESGLDLTLPPHDTALLVARAPEFTRNQR